MRTWALGAAIMFGFGAAHAAPDSAISVGPGSFVYWASLYEGNSDRYREELLADLGDVHVYRTGETYSNGDASDYHALFSGIYFATCDTVMPTRAERDALAALWPLSEGASVEITSGDGASFTVGAPTKVFLMGHDHPAHIVSGIYPGDAEEDESTETLVVLDRAPLTATVDWQGEGREKMLLVTRPKPDRLEPLDTDLIGNCAQLLIEQTDKN